MHLSGQLSDWSISDLLQIMQVTQKTGSLDIEAYRRGRIHFRDGSVTGAELIGIKGSYMGSDRAGVADILYVLSTLDDGSFAVGAADGPEGSGWSVEDVLADVDALKSLESEVIDAGLFEAAGVRFVKSIDSPITIQPDDWEVLMSLVQPFTFEHLEVRMGRGGAVCVFHTLHRLGVAEVIEGDEESDWLDHLADAIAPESSDPTWLEHVEEKESETETEPEAESETKLEVEVEPAAAVTPDAPEDLEDAQEEVHEEVRGVSAPASTTLTDGVYDEIRRLRSKVAEK
jgi:hypothetical protein